MTEQYFGTKELYSLVLRAKDPILLGERLIVPGEPILVFNDIKLATIQEQTKGFAARGGQGNMPRVIWESREDVHFILTEGVLNRTGMAMVLSAGLISNPAPDRTVISKQEIVELNQNGRVQLKEKPILDLPHFCFVYQDRNLQGKTDFDIEDKTLIVHNPIPNSQYLMDYQFQYGHEALIYTIGRERFNGVFSLEGRFYTQDENQGLDRTNIIRMPKVRVMSNLNLHLGEKAEPVISVFKIVAIPEKIAGNDYAFMDIVELDRDIDADI